MPLHHKINVTVAAIESMRSQHLARDGLFVFFPLLSRERQTMVMYERNMHNFVFMSIAGQPYSEVAYGPNTCVFYVLCLVLF